MKFFKSSVNSTFLYVFWVSSRYKRIGSSLNMSVERLRKYFYVGRLLSSSSMVNVIVDWPKSVCKCVSKQFNKASRNFRKSNKWNRNVNDVVKILDLSIKYKTVLLRKNRGGLVTGLSGSRDFLCCLSKWLFQISTRTCYQ